MNRLPSNVMAVPRPKLRLVRNVLISIGLIFWLCQGTLAQTADPSPEEQSAGGDVATTGSDELVVPFPPDYSAVDENGVDMVSGRTRFRVQGLEIGGADMRIGHTLVSDTNGFNWLNPIVDNFSGGVGRILEFGSYSSCGSSSPFLAGLGGNFERFCLVDGQFQSVLENGSKLVDNQNGTWTYTNRDGSAFLISSAFTNPASEWGHLGLVIEGRFPDGKVLRIHRKKVTYFSSASGTNKTVNRIQSVTQSDGLQVKYLYAVNTTPSDSTVRGWKIPNGVIGINNAHEFCAPMADQCALSLPWPRANYIWSGSNRILTITDAGGRVTRYTHDEYSRVIGVKPPSSPSVDKFSYDYCPHLPGGTSECEVTICGGGGGNCESFTILDKVRGSIRNGAVFTYEFITGIGGGNLSVYESFHPLGARMEFISQANSGIVTNATDRFGRRMEFSLDRPNRLIETTEPDGAVISYEYDERGNIVSIRNGQVNDLQAPLLYRAAYPSACNNLVTCNKPIWSLDANGNRTDYSYGSVHGNLLSVTGPAVNGTRPQTRFTYVQRFAWVKNAKGGFVRASEPIWVPASKSFCKTGAASGSGCAVSGDEVRTTFEYGPDNGPSNLFLKGQVVTTGGQSLRTCFGYDRYGNRISETLPSAGRTSCP